MTVGAHTTKPLLLHLLVALLCVVWSSTWLVIRFGLEDLPPLTSAAVRFLVAGACMALLAPFLHRREGAPPPQRWLWLVAGGCNFAGSYGVLYIAETVVPSGIAAVLWAVFPLLMATSGRLFLGERLRRRQWLGFLLAFCGVVLMFGGDLGGIGRDGLPMALLLLLSPIVTAVGTTLIKRHGSDRSSVLLNRNGMLTGAVLLSLAALLREGVVLDGFTAPAIAATLYLALVGTVLTFGVYFWLLRQAQANRLSLISYVTPCLALLLAAAAGDGTLDAFALGGTGLVVSGVACVVVPRRGVPG